MKVKTFHSFAVRDSLFLFLGVIVLFRQGGTVKRKDRSRKQSRSLPSREKQGAVKKWVNSSAPRKWSSSSCFSNWKQPTMLSTSWAISASFSSKTYAALSISLAPDGVPATSQAYPPVPPKALGLWLIWIISEFIPH